MSDNYKKVEGEADLVRDMNSTAIINRNKSGVFHLGSRDLVHHDDFIKEIIETLGHFKPLFKNVYTTNEARYLPVLSKVNNLPKHLQLQSEDIFKELKV